MNLTYENLLNCRNNIREIGKTPKCVKMCPISHNLLAEVFIHTDTALKEISEFMGMKVIIDESIIGWKLEYE